MKERYSGISPKETSQDSGERDPQGWNLQPVPDEESQYIQRMDERGFFDSSSAGRALTKLQKQLAPDSRQVVIGRQVVNDNSRFMRLCNDVVEAVSRGGTLDDAAVQHPGLVVSFPNMPSPDELREFVARNSVAAGYVQGWTSTGEIPYLVLESKNVGAVEFGTMYVNSETRSRDGWAYRA